MTTKTMLIFFGVLALAVGGLWYFNSNKTTPTPEMIVGQTNSRYVAYSSETFTQSVGKKRVLYFHAPWCPTCKVANKEFEENANQIPNDVVLFKTDYDTEKDLKTKYGITYQHTFVLFDNQGNEVKKWNGGGIRELVLNTNNL